MQNAKKLRDNKMNFPEFYDEKFEGLTFDMPLMFEKSYMDNFVLSDVYDTYYVSDLDLYFAVEKFSTTDIEELSFIHGDQTNKLELVHSFHIKKREKSLINYLSSTRKDFTKTIGIPTYIQVVNTNNDTSDEYSYYENQSYFTAAMEIGSNIYVFQMIGKEDNMRFLYDDFIRILKSVR